MKITKKRVALGAVGALVAVGMFSACSDSTTSDVQSALATPAASAPTKSAPPASAPAEYASARSIPSPELLEIERVRDDWHRPDIAPPSWTTTFTLTTRSGYSYITGTPPVAPSAAELSAGDA